jgi:hypothetical protein
MMSATSNPESKQKEPIAATTLRTLAVPPAKSPRRRRRTPSPDRACPRPAWWYAYRGRYGNHGKHHRQHASVDAQHRTLPRFYAEVTTKRGYGRFAMGNDYAAPLPSAAADLDYRTSNALSFARTSSPPLKRYVCRSRCGRDHLTYPRSRLERHARRDPEHPAAAAAGWLPLLRACDARISGDCRRGAVMSAYHQ